jgi:Secretion system C-terminal sorting domain
MQKLYGYILLAILLSGISSAQNIYWIESAFDTPRLIKSDSSGAELFSKALAAGSLPQDITLDNATKTLYWTELAFKNAHINTIGSDFNLSSAIVDSQSAARGIAFDALNNKIYWTSTNLIEGPKIWRCDRNGTNREVLIDFGAGSNNTLRSICLDPAAGKMYWANFTEGKIQKADMASGASVEDIVTGLNGPCGLALDADSAKIFWTEMNSQQIKSADIDGNNIRLLVNGLSYPAHISVNRELNRMAWTELGTGKIRSATLDGSAIRDYNVTALTPTGIFIEPPQPLSGNLVISPRDTVLQVHDFASFKAQIVDSQDVATDIDASWFVKRQAVGAITQNGLFFSYFPGRAYVTAKYDTLSAHSRVTVVDTTRDSSGVNKVKIFGNFRGKEFELKTIKEGETFVLGGVPHPFNIINAALIYFPKGSLHENIKLEIKLPEFCKIKDDSVEFIDNIINGIQFNVYAGDSIAEPYYFDKPVSVSLPYKRGILKHFGINPENLAMFFATDSITFDSLGITHVMIDTSRNRIYGLLEHFSTLVIREKETVTALEQPKDQQNLPAEFVLKQNYPNPFNPTTMISYTIGSVKTQPAVSVHLSIYNMLGQKVATLVNKKQQAGRYQVEWDASAFASGIYVYTLEAGMEFKQSKKLVLLK